MLDQAFLAAEDTIPGEHISDDQFLGGRLRIYQPLTGYRAGIDPVFLAAAVPAEGTERILDMGVGVGVASFCLLKRCPHVQVTGIDISASLTHLATLNHQRNRFKDRFKALTCDVQHLNLDTQFDHVMSNPPFLRKNQGDAFISQDKAQATVESLTDLKTWIQACLRHLKPKGTLTLIFRADRADELITLLYQESGSLSLTPLLPKEGSPARRIIVSYQKGSKAPFELRAGRVLHEATGAFTQQAQYILREGRALFPATSQQQKV
ncbi:MAG: tRNA1(Val) (adenine(37)-N6)-methyltransferase [Alphaproteobacteria bacterium]